MLLDKNNMYQLTLYYFTNQKSSQEQKLSCVAYLNEPKWLAMYTYTKQE